MIACSARYPPPRSRAATASPATSRVVRSLTTRTAAPGGTQVSKACRASGSFRPRMISVITLCFWPQAQVSPLGIPILLIKSDVKNHYLTQRR